MSGTEGGASQFKLTFTAWRNDPRCELPDWLESFVTEPRRHDFTFMLRTAVGPTPAYHRVKLGDVVVHVPQGLPVIIRRPNVVGTIR